MLPKLVVVPEVRVLSACRVDKLSFHILVPNVLFDCPNTSMAFYVWEFSNYLVKAFQRLYRRSYSMADESVVDRGLRRFLVRTIMADLVDLSVYSAQRQFRLLGCCKEGGYPLRLVPLSGPFCHLSDVSSKFSDIVPDLDVMTKYLVCPSDLAALDDTMFLHVSPNGLCAVRAWRMRYFKRTDTTGRRCDFSAEMRYRKELPLGIVAEQTSNITDSFMKLLQNPSDDMCSRMVFGDHPVLDEFGRLRQISKLSVGEVVYDTGCETKEVNGVLIPHGTPSAVVLRSMDGNTGYYCFNCHEVVWCSYLWSGNFMAVYESEYINTPHGKMNFDGRVDVDVERHEQFLFLDAPPGSGKTELVKKYLDAHPAISVLCISFRIALTNYLATRLGLISYQTQGILDRGAHGKRKRLSICCDSLVHLHDLDIYDMIVLDEGGMTKYHLASVTMQSRCVQVLRRLEYILSKAKKILVSQFRLTETDVRFYCGLVGVDPEDRQLVSRRKLNRPPPLHPVQQVDDFSIALSRLIAFYREQYDVNRDRTNCPIICFFTNMNICRCVMALMKMIAPSPLAQDRIIGVWSSNQDEDWPRKFLSDPNYYSHQADVLLITPILQAGHSLDGWFQCAFDFLHSGVLTHREEVQLIGRLRLLGRSDLYTWRFAFIEKGRPDSRLVQQERVHNNMTKTLKVMSLLAELSNSVQVDILSERHMEHADTVNRHSYLWEQEYAQAQITFETMRSFTHWDEWTADRCRTWVKDYMQKTGKSISRFFLCYTEQTLDEDMRRVYEESQILDSFENFNAEIQATKMSIQSVLGWADKDQAVQIIARIFPTKAMNSTKAVKYLAKYFAFGRYLDLCIHEHRSQLVPDRMQDYWETRLSHATTAQEGVKLSSVFFTRNLCRLLFPEDGILSFPIGSFTLSTDAEKRAIEGCLGAPHLYESFHQQSLRKTLANDKNIYGVLKKCLNNMGLQCVNTRKRSAEDTKICEISFSSVVNACTILRLLYKPDHFATFQRIPELSHAFRASETTFFASSPSLSTISSDRQLVVRSN